MDLRPRALLQRLSDVAAQGDDEPDDNQQTPEPVPAPAPPAKPVRGGAGMVDWWNARNAGDDEQPEKPGAEPCAHPNPHAVHSRPTGQLVAYWCADCETQLPVPEDYDELDDEDGEGEDGEPTGDKVPAKIRRQWSVRGNGGKVYARPKYRGSGTKDEKKSLLDAWHGIRPVTRHALYNATALCIGFSVGVPQFFTHETAYLVHTYGSWTSFYVVIWYGVAAGIWVIDHRTRDWLPPFALLGRMPLVSLVVGVLLYGNPV